MYRIKWKHPNFTISSVGPNLIHTQDESYYTKKEAKEVCKRYNENSNIIHTVIWRER